MLFGVIHFLCLLQVFACNAQGQHKHIYLTIFVAKIIKTCQFPSIIIQSDVSAKILCCPHFLTDVKHYQRLVPGGLALRNKTI